MSNKFIGEIEDVRLLESMVHGSDMDAFGVIYKKYVKQLSQYAFQFTKSRFITDEIMQEVFLKLWDHRKKLRKDGNIKSYLYNMVRNRSLNYIRDAVQHEDLAEVLKKDYLKACEQPDYVLISQEYDNLVKNVIERLPKGKKDIYQLSREDGKTNLEIAQELGITVKTVRNQLRSSLQFIKKHVERHFCLILAIFILP